MSAAPENTVVESFDHLFRQNAGQMVSVLARIFGLGKIDIVEDAVQEAMLAAMRKWPFAGVPENPSAWLTQVAKNKILDQLRRARFSTELDALELDPEDERETDTETLFTAEIAEDQLRMIYACCDPQIPADSQVALTLKTVGGFSIGEIARAYLAKEEAVAKLLTRAKKKLKEGGLRFEIPFGEKLAERTDAVLRVLYLMFNEGYAATGGDELTRRDLCFEAVRLCTIVADHPATSVPKANALAALFLFQAARFKTRTGSAGELILLADQDRSQWDRQLLSEGLSRFRLSAAGDELSDYHIEAEIASLHALAADFSSTDWRRVIECYAILQARRFSPVVELNRIVAVGQIRGSAAALSELSDLGANYMMTSFNLFHIVKAHFLQENGDLDAARKAYGRALELTHNETVRRFLQQKTTMLTS